MTRIDSVSHVVSHIHNHRLIKHDCILKFTQNLCNVLGIFVYVISYAPVAY